MAANDTLGLSGRMETYEKRLAQFLVAIGNSEDEERKEAVFLTVIGEHAYTVLRDLVHPEKPADKGYAELAGELKRHFQHQDIVIAERFKFHRRNQKQGESVKDFITSLRRLSEH